MVGVGVLVGKPEHSCCGWIWHSGGCSVGDCGGMLVVVGVSVLVVCGRSGGGRSWCSDGVWAFW